MNKNPLTMMRENPLMRTVSAALLALCVAFCTNTCYVCIQ